MAFHHLINLLLTLASLAYPLGWLFLPESQGLGYLVLLISILWAIKAVQAVGWQRYFALIMACLVGVIYVTQTLATMYWYPVIINGVMLTLFGSSLWAKQSIIERFARLRRPDLPPKGVRYTRKVTQVWCLFFLFNILFCSLLIVLEAYRLWAWYTGGISYLLIGLLMIAEWLVRQHLMKTDTP